MREVASVSARRPLADCDEKGHAPRHHRDAWVVAHLSAVVCLLRNRTPEAASRPRALGFLISPLSDILYRAGMLSQRWDPPCCSSPLLSVLRLCASCRSSPPSGWRLDAA